MTPSPTKANLVIAVDDTDNPDEGGTGRVARGIADRLADRYPVWGVTRHQLAVLTAIPYTRKNSANVVHLFEVPEDLNELTDIAQTRLRELRLDGSEPGLCIAETAALSDVSLGREAKQRFVTRDEVRAAAEGAGATLLHPCGPDDGIVGAFAGACLASGGNDGRFVRIGAMREIEGRELTVDDILQAGGDEVRSVEHTPLTEGTIVGERLRPALCGGRCVLYCYRRPDGTWAPIHGAPGDREREDALHADQ